MARIAQISIVSMGGGRRWLRVAPAHAVTSLTVVTWFEHMQPGAAAGNMLSCVDEAHAD